MQDIVTPNKDLLDVLVQVLVLVIPIVIAWFINTYVKGSKYEKDAAAIVQLSNSAIDLVENMDTRGALNLPPDAKKSVYKLQLASQWLNGELNRAGIKMSEEDAKNWITSEFQKRMGDVRPVKQIAELSQQAMDLILNLEQSGAIKVPPDADRIAYLGGLAADWALAHLPSSWTNITRDEVFTWTRAELLKSQLPPSAAPVQDRLPQLANAAVAFVDQLKASNSLTVRPGTSGANVESDLALAWMMTEVAKQGLSVTSDQIAQAVATALQRKSAPA
jgi:hypothetical protein